MYASHLAEAVTNLHLAVVVPFKCAFTPRFEGAVELIRQAK